MKKCHDCLVLSRLDNAFVYSKMNPLEGENGEASVSHSQNGLAFGSSSTPGDSPDDNSSSNNDNTNRFQTKPGNVKTRLPLLNNLTEDSGKVNNNAGPSRMCFRYQNGASTSRACEEGNTWNVDIANDVEKCPNKVHNGSIDVGSRRKFRRRRSSDDESSSGNEGEDCCIYTYKGSLQADLPNSFFTLDRLANGLEGQADEPVQEMEVLGSNPGSSPDNDFLEMDFDPGPSLDLDMEESEMDQDGRVSPVPELPNEQVAENDLSAENENTETADYVNNVVEEVRPPPRDPSPQPPPPVPCSSSRPVLTLPTSSCSNSAPRYWAARESWGHHCSSGDLCSPWESNDLDSGSPMTLWNATSVKLEGDGVSSSSDTRKYNLFSDLYHCIMAKRLVMEKNASFTDVGKSDTNDLSPDETSTPPVNRTMIWTEQEACLKQVTQISTSACGATAAINAMMTFNTPFSVEKLKKGVGTRLRQESAPIPQYLVSRSSAGATHKDIINGIEAASEGKLYAKFFHMYPERKFSLCKWLSYWMRKGAVPIATLNLQAGLPPGAPVPDAWHHQMIFGVSPRGVFLTNPLQCVSEGALLVQLCSPSVLKVKRTDIIQRWSMDTDLMPLIQQSDVRWKKMNVLGQVVNLIREGSGRSTNQHITIPAAYQSGITLIISKEAPALEELMAHPPLPLLAR